MNYKIEFFEYFAQNQSKLKSVLIQVRKDCKKLGLSKMAEDVVLQTIRNRINWDDLQICSKDSIYVYKIQMIAYPFINSKSPSTTHYSISLHVQIIEHFFGRKEKIFKNSL